MGWKFWILKPPERAVVIVEVMESLTLRVVPMPMPDEVDQSFEVELHYFKTKASELKKLPNATDSLADPCHAYEGPSDCCGKCQTRVVHELTMRAAEGCFGTS